jgi:hypothetical protein
VLAVSDRVLVAVVLVHASENVNGCDHGNYDLTRRLIYKFDF